jgi:hypothetical protein
MNPWMRRLTLGLTGFGLLLAAGRAEAQTLTIPDTGIQRPDRDNEFGLKINEINQDDCYASDTFVFTTTLMGLTTQDVEVWEGTSCEVDSNRNGDNATCRKVDIERDDNVIRITVPAMIRPETDTTTDVCADPFDAEGTMTLNFLIVDGTTVPTTFTPATYQVVYDLIGPDAPTDVSVSIGEESLILDWEESSGNSDDIGGYRFYCDVGCDSPNLPNDQVASATYECGNAGKNSESGQTDSDLENGTSYTVGVAAIDLLGNAGPISTTVCGTPEPIVGFYEAYRAAGGKGGGGNICSFSPPSRTGMAGFGAGAALFLAAALRRVRSGRRRS